MNGSKMKVMTYNILNGGLDADRDRLELLAQVINSVEPDLLVLNEAVGLLPVGRPGRSSNRFHRLQALTGLEGHLLECESTSHVALFHRSGSPPLTMDALPGRFFHGALMGRWPAQGSRKPLAVVATHLDPFSAVQRTAEAEYLAQAVSHHRRDQEVILAGDMNSIAALDPERGLLGREPPGSYSARLVDSTGKLDSAPLGLFERVGLQDCFRQAHPEEEGATDPTPPHRRPGEPPLRIDFILATSDLSERLQDCRVVTGASADEASDHYPVVADFDRPF